MEAAGLGLRNGTDCNSRDLFRYAREISFSEAAWVTLRKVSRPCKAQRRARESQSRVERTKSRVLSLGDLERRDDVEDLAARREVSGSFWSRWQRLTDRRWSIPARWKGESSILSTATAGMERGSPVGEQRYRGNAHQHIRNLHPFAGEQRAISISLSRFACSVPFVSVSCDSLRSPLLSRRDMFLISVTRSGEMSKMIRITIPAKRYSSIPSSTQ